MNIKKGINRIAIALAVIAIVPSFFWRWEACKDERAEELKFIIEITSNLHREENVLSPWDKIINSKRWGTLSDRERKKVYNGYLSDMMQSSRWSQLSEEQQVKAKKVMQREGGITFDTDFENKYNMQAIFELFKNRVGSSIVLSMVTFLIVFFGINSIARVIFWIVSGFKNEKRGEETQ